MIKFLIIALAFFCGTTFSQVITRSKEDPTILKVTKVKKKDQLAPAASDACAKIDKFVTHIELLEINDGIFSLDGTFKCRYISDTPERPSALQQRVLQIRRFVTKENTYAAFMEWGAVSGFIVNGQTLTHPITGLEIKSEFSGANLSDIRIRVFEREIAPGANKRVEVFNKKLYQDIFDSLAQQLFVQGIEIPPSEMN